jgi:hypothetical protein
MKNIFLMLFVAAIAFTSCKKEDCPTVTPPVDLSGNTFRGSAVVSGITYNPFTIVFSNDGTCSVTFQGLPTFSGSWSKSPTSSIVYFFFDETATSKWKGQATLNTANNKLEAGTLTRTAPSAITGTFTADKQ